MAPRLIVLLAVMVLTNLSVSGQSTPSIQGVWRPVEVTVTNPNPPPLGLAKGMHTNLQPALLMFTAKHFSQVIDTAGQPRPKTPTPAGVQPPAETMWAVWGPFVANAGTYEVSGTTLTTTSIVAKAADFQGGASRLTIKLKGNNLWTTLVELPSGKVAYPLTVKFVRVE